MKAGLLAVALVALGSGAGLAASPFDGSWTVSQSCPPTAQDVRGYRWVYKATVRDGALSGEFIPSRPSEGSLRITGQIEPDGNALVTADGLTGLPEYSVGHVAQGYHVHYSFPAHFTEASGTGTRSEQRRCDFSFKKN